MEPRKLTKEDIDKVRHIEGFPIAKDEDIIALSSAPSYTACPNPFIEDFLNKYGTPYDEAMDDYHREPFAADVSEGKYDPLYKLHSYPTKVPHKAIMRYILHYTNPGDIVFDGFCGTGMTGLAAQSCGIYGDVSYSYKNEKANDNFGYRKSILCDLSPTATFIAHNYNAHINYNEFFSIAESLIRKVEDKYEWMNYTNTPNMMRMQDSMHNSKINYIVWSRVYSCPNCSNEFTLWNATVDYDFDKSIGNVRDKFKCSKCSMDLTIRDISSAKRQVYDNVLNQVIEEVVNQPVLVNYIYDGKRYEKEPDSYDLEIINKINEYKTDKDVPCGLLPFMHETHQRRRWDLIGATHEHHLYTKKTLLCYSELFYEAEKLDEKYRNRFKFLLTSCFNRTTKLVRYMAQHKEKNVGPLSGTLYTTSIFGEINVFQVLWSRLSKMKNAYVSDKVEELLTENVLISTQSTTEIELPQNSIDYIFVDPPFGDNLMYSELNRFTEMWFGVYENIKDETIINKAQNKSIDEYQHLMKKSFEKMYHALKPGRWITVEFHNSRNAVWNAIQETLQFSGFIIADVRTLDKGKGTTKQMTYASTVKQDLVISAYKPKGKFKREFLDNAGTIESTWLFVRQHLENLPVVVINSSKIEVVAERQPYLLFDRMVAYHIMNAISVPLDATDFYKGLDENFLKRDGMYFLPDQVNEYDTARITNDVEPIQFELFVTNEKSAIVWLYQQLDTPQTYSEIQPKFMQEIKAWDKFEKRPELNTLLEENFLQDESGKWYVPDVTKSADVIRLRDKKLFKEFEGYIGTKGKLKLFRAEAIRVGFAKLWADKNYKLIVETADRLPESIIQEDDKLLMYYDISLGRI